MKKKIVSVVAAALLLTAAFSGSVFADSPDTLKNKIELPGTAEPSKDFRNFNADNFKLPQTLNKNGASPFPYSKAAESDVLYESEPNDYPNQADSLPMNKGIAGAFQWEDDIDFYKVKVTTTDYMVVLGGTVYDYPYMELAYGVFDSKLNFIEPELYEYEDGIYYQIVPVKPGDYYILAMDYLMLGSNEPYLLMAQILDTKAPSAPTVNAIDDNDTSISGKAEKNSTVTIKNGSTVLGKPKADSSGNFNLTVKKIKAGSKITATATDAAGNVSKATTVTVADKTAPGAPKVNAVDDNDESVSGKAEANSTVTVKNGKTTLGSPKVDKSGNFKLSIKSVKSGTKLTFTAKDAAGNVSKATTVTVADKTAPGAPKVNAVDDNDESVSGKAEANSTVTVKNGKTILGSPKADKSGNFKLSIKSVKAGTKLTFAAKDAAGNVSKTTTVTVADKTAPSLTLKDIYSTTKTATGKTEAGAKLTFKVGKTTIGSGTANSKGDFKITIKPQKKSTTITVSASDEAKNTRTITTKVK